MSKISRLVTKVQIGQSYSILIIGLALLSIVLLSCEIIFALEGDSLQLIRKIDITIAFLFLADFILGLFFNRYYPNKLNYFKHNWLNLVSAIPISTEFAQLLRFLRILSAFRTIRAGLSVRKINKNLNSSQ